MKFEIIEKEIKNNFDLSDKLWCVFTGISKQKLEFEKWVFFTDKELSENLSNFYEKFVKNNKKISALIVDIIKNIEEIKTLEQLKKVDILTDGIFIGDIKDESIWWFILPNTNNITSVKQAIDTIKQKNEFSSKNVNIYVFNTTRFTFEN